MNPSDAIEACSFLGTAYQFQVPGALSGVQKALFQIFSPDQSVRDNLVSVYKDIYLSSSNNQLTPRQKALTAIKALIQLLRGMQPGRSPELAKLITPASSSEKVEKAFTEPEERCSDGIIEKDNEKISSIAPISIFRDQPTRTDRQSRLSTCDLIAVARGLALPSVPADAPHPRDNNRLDD